jgi:hypothetical protein
MAVIGEFAWQGWLFVACMIGVPIVLSAVLGRGR